MVIRNTNHVMSDSCVTYYKRVCIYVHACIAKIRVWLFIKVILLLETLIRSVFQFRLPKQRDQTIFMAL